MKYFSLRILFVLSLLLGIQTAGLASAEDASQAVPANLTTEQFPGHSFTFLNLPADQQNVGYKIFTPAQAEQGDQSSPINFAEHFAKEATVNKVILDPVTKEYLVYLTVNNTGEQLAERTRNGQLSSLVLTSDLINAKKQFMGKTIYPKTRNLSGSDDVTTPILIGSAVTVVDVVASSQAQKPISLVVSVNGKNAILPIAYSWTNIPTANWSNAPAWQEDLFLQNPRTTLGWSSAVWKNIEKASVVETMTKDQVLLSWGKPNRTENNSTAWIYGSKKLNFSGNVVSSIETITEAAPIETIS
jgi:hypothetical protein